MGHLRRGEPTDPACRAANAARSKGYVRREIACACCGEAGHHHAHGWITACYQRWLHAGKPASGPPPSTEAKRETVLWLLKQGEHREQVMTRAGVSIHQIRRYLRQAS